MSPSAGQREPATAKDTWIGCPHCGQGVDITAQVARAQREVSEQVFGLLRNGVPVRDLLPAVERFGHESGWIEDAARVAAGPLRLLAIPPRQPRSSSKRRG